MDPCWPLVVRAEDDDFYARVCSGMDLNIRGSLESVLGHILIIHHTQIVVVRNSAKNPLNCESGKAEVRFHFSSIIPFRLLTLLSQPFGPNDTLSSRQVLDLYVGKPGYNSARWRKPRIVNMGEGVPGS